jgi:hypothetical protein
MDVNCTKPSPFSKVLKRQLNRIVFVTTQVWHWELAHFMGGFVKGKGINWGAQKLTGEDLKVVWLSFQL